jgi:hypothetical protein
LSDEGGRRVAKGRHLMRMPHCHLALLLASGLALAGSACTPTVQVAAPKEPITINLNIKLDADIRLRVEEKAKQDVKTKPIF